MTSKIPTKLYRQASIYRNIKNRSYISLSGLVDSVQRDMLHNEYNMGISQRSIQRDIREMNINWISIQYDRHHKGYYIPEDEKIDSIIEDIWMRLSLLSALKATGNLSDFMLPEQREIVGLPNLPLLVTALKKNLIVKFDYQKFTDIVASSRSIEPYFLKQFEGRWYVIAKEVGNNTMKTWGLERISNLELTNSRFQRDPEYNTLPDKDSFGIYTSSALPIEEVVLSFTPKSGRYIITRPLHHSQEVLIDNNSEIRIKLHVKLTNDFIMELLSQTSKMTVISPQHLKDHFRKIYLQAIKRMNYNPTKQ